jgi:small subunit ribosomal protein S17
MKRSEETHNVSEEAKVEAAEETRGSRKVRQGLVVSAKMAKTVVVSIERRVQHPLYGKVVRRTKRFKAHDDHQCDVGDRVEIMETRPISKEKRWRVTRILEKVK